jgi:chorismate mutase/prephenate dehydratase
MTYEEEIGPLREEIDRLNREIVALLARRVDVALQIGEVKTRHGRLVVDRSREALVYKRVRGLAEGFNLIPDDVELVFREIIALCTRVQQEE